MEINANFPEKLKLLFKPSRYKVLYGGRGGAKSWSVARALIIKAVKQKLRILCAREIQKSIKDSVHKLLADQIKDLGLSALFDIKQASITCRANGSEFFFEGLRHNPFGIKSYEGIDIVWVEEAHTVSKTSWDILIPTVRKEDSEIWLTFNPELEDDETYQRFVVHAPDNALVEKVNWRDNPWFPEVLKVEMAALKVRNYDSYLHVWEGHCREILEGAIYADEMRQAKAEGRITVVPYDESKPVNTYWDLGWADFTTIWFVQTVGKEIRFIDYYHNHLKKLTHYVQVLQNKGYVYGIDYLPHDARAQPLAASGRSIEDQLRSMGRNVSIVARESVMNGIYAARMLFNHCWFDRDKCSDGLQSLRHYRFEQDPNTGKFSEKPLHDEHSNGADAFRMFAMGHAYNMPHTVVAGVGASGDSYAEESDPF